MSTHDAAVRIQGELGPDFEVAVSFGDRGIHVHWHGDPAKAELVAEVVNRHFPDHHPMRSNTAGTKGPGEGVRYQGPGLYEDWDEETLCSVWFPRRT